MQNHPFKLQAACDFLNANAFNPWLKPWATNISPLWGFCIVGRDAMCKKYFVAIKKG
jgi:hypothetical protein